MDSVFLGFDLSTQSLTAVAVDSNGTQFYNESVNFDTLVYHDTPVHRSPPYSSMPARLFVEALDAILEKMRTGSFPFSRVTAISGAAQQHGSAYLTSKFETTLASLDSTLPLYPQIQPNSFAFQHAPIWEDSSTPNECEVIERGLGGIHSMAAVTGSRATLRFTGPQILAKYNRDKEKFALVSRVALISAFFGSLFVGKLIPEDTAEACGTHLFDLKSDPPAWLQSAVSLVKADSKLCTAPVHSYSIVGSISNYLCERYGIPDSVPVVAFSGDNPCSIAALPSFKPGDVLISLGTSDTVQWLVEEDKLQTTSRGAAIAMTFRSPLTAKPSYVRMLVYANGSLTREAVRDQTFTCIGNSSKLDKISWEEFEKLVNQVPPGCEPKKVGCFHFRPEIIPRLPSESNARVIDVSTGQSTTANHTELCRLVLEWRALVFKAHLQVLGINCMERIIVVGGAAQSGVIPQILADVLNAPVFRLVESASAALGAARRAKAGFMVSNGLNAPLASSENSNVAMDLVAEPRRHLVAMYNDILQPAHNTEFECWKV